MPPSIAVIIPVWNAAEYLEKCLASLAASTFAPLESIVVDDGSLDRSAEVARHFGAKVLATGGRYGPARARNLGAASACGDLLLFLDADVCVRTDTLAQVAGAFEAGDSLDALFGSYDDAPAVQGLVSVYKNLRHSFIHQSGRRNASTFWAGCGAIRRAVFVSQGGFDETRKRPAIEDIELGYRLVQSGRKIVLEPTLQVKHLKGWTLSSLIRTDVLDRAIPWTELILRDGSMPNDLNVSWSQRASVALALGLVGEPVIGTLALIPLRIVFVVWVASLFGNLALNREFYRFLIARHGWRFALAAVPLHVLYHFYSGISFAAGAARHAWRSTFEASR